VLAEKPDPTGEKRVRERDQGKALAGKSTLNRLELTGAEVSEGERYKKIGLDFEAADRRLGEVFLQAHREPPQQIILGLDSTDDPLHGNQEGRFFHGYYGHYCYLPLYIFSGEHLWCARGEMENRIKEQLMLFADRTSTAYLRSNQIRLYFSSVAYLLMQALRRLGLQGTEWAKAQCTTLRLKLLKIGALIRITVRKVWVSMASGYPYAERFRQVYARLQAMPLRA